MRVPEGVSPYQGIEHQSFEMSGGRFGAVLVHGFLSTPAEMRPLAESLNRAGWTVRAPLLPGHGPGVFSLPQRRRAEWVETVRRDVIDLRRGRHAVVVIAHSMGGAVAVHAAAQTPTDGLGLLAPYWLFGNRFHHLTWPVTRLVAGRMRPLRRADPSSLVWRRRLSRVLPDVDLESPAVHRALREFRVPVPLVDELHALGTDTFRLARSVHEPVLRVQGVDDQVVRAHATRTLAGQFPQLQALAEVPGTHDLLSQQAEAWPHVEAALHRFLHDLPVVGNHDQVLGDRATP